MSQVSEPTPFHHVPVMESEVVAVLGAVPRGVLVDATLGAGGHSAALLAAHRGLCLLGLDADADALEAAASRLEPWMAAGRVVLRRARFDRLAEEVVALRSLGHPPSGRSGEGRPEADWHGWPVTGVLFDLGVSSPQLDRPERGFSYRQPGPLDMRMDRDQERTAADVVNTYSEAQLAGLFRRNGEGRFAMRIARAIVARRPLLGTVELAETVRDAIPAAARRRGGHPAKRVFQAIRIEVNAELEVLGPALATALEVLAPGGRLVVLTYHSGEDRIVKSVLVNAATGGCTCPPGLPCVCGADPRSRLVFRGSRTPSPDETASNRRAESARLRAAERLPTNRTGPQPPGGTRGALGAP